MALLIGSEDALLTIIGKDNAPKKDIELTRNIELVNNLTDFIYLEKIFNGNGHTITFKKKHNSTGLFSLSGGKIQNIHIKTNNSSLEDGNGWLVGPNSYGIIENCSSDGIVAGSDTGGIVGTNFGGKKSSISWCHHSGNIYGTGNGGIAGSFLHGCMVDSCYSTGKIAGDGVGGIIGAFAGKGDDDNTDENAHIVTIFSSYSCGNIKGSNSGGLVGSNSYMINIQESYTLGSIGDDTSSNIGGLIGSVDENCEKLYIRNSYSLGDIISNGKKMDASGGLIGIIKTEDNGNPLVIKNCYTIGKTVHSGTIVGVIDSTCKLYISECSIYTRSEKHPKMVYRGKYYNYKNLFDTVPPNKAVLNPVWNEQIWEVGRNKYPLLRSFRNINPLTGIEKDGQNSWYDYVSNSSSPKFNVSCGINSNLKALTVNGQIFKLPNITKSYLLFDNGDKEKRLVVLCKLNFLTSELVECKLNSVIKRVSDTRYKQYKYIIENTCFIKYIKICYDDVEYVIDMFDLEFKKYTTVAEFHSQKLPLLDPSERGVHSDVKVTRIGRSKEGLYIPNGTHQATPTTIKRSFIVNSNNGIVTISLSKDKTNNRTNLLNCNSVEINVEGDYSNSRGMLIDGNIRHAQF